MTAVAENAERLILLAPISPATGGNGLAMRSDLFRRAAACDFDVETVVVPVAGRVPDTGEPASNAIVVPAGFARARTEARALVGDPVWRDRLSRAGTLPRLARAASPVLASSVVSALITDRAVAVHVMRSYLAPLGLAVAERVGARSRTLDLDDDDAAFARALGEREEAAAYTRLIDAFGAAFDALSAASAAEAGVIGERHGLAVEHIPNAVDLPRGLQRPAETGRPSEVSLLLVANLTYAPNVEAASLLVEAILPRVQARLGRRVRVTLVGHHHPELKRLAGPGVELAGFVPHLRSVYQAADVVVVPISVGGGTRIKLLEAFAHRVPVVASPAAAAGLAVSDGRHLQLAEDPDRAAKSIEAIVTQPAVAESLVEEAWTLVRDRYCTDAVVPQIRRFLARTTMVVSR